MSHHPSIEHSNLCHYQCPHAPSCLLNELFKPRLAVHLLSFVAAFNDVHQSIKTQLRMFKNGRPKSTQAVMTSPESDHLVSVDGEYGCVHSSNRFTFKDVNTLCVWGIFAWVIGRSEEASFWFLHPRSALTCGLHSGIVFH